MNKVCTIHMAKDWYEQLKSCTSQPFIAFRILRLDQTIDLEIPEYMRNVTFKTERNDYLVIIDLPHSGCNQYDNGHNMSRTYFAETKYIDYYVSDDHKIMASCNDPTLIIKSLTYYNTFNDLMNDVDIIPVVTSRYGFECPQKTRVYSLYKYPESMVKTVLEFTIKHLNTFDPNKFMLSENCRTVYQVILEDEEPNYDQIGLVFKTNVNYSDLNIMTDINEFFTATGGLYAINADTPWMSKCTIAPHIYTGKIPFLRKKDSAIKILNHDHRTLITNNCIVAIFESLENSLINSTWRIADEIPNLLLTTTGDFALICPLDNERKGSVELTTGPDREVFSYNFKNNGEIDWGPTIFKHFHLKNVTWIIDGIDKFYDEIIVYDDPDLFFANVEYDNNFVITRVGDTDFTTNYTGAPHNLGFNNILTYTKIKLNKNDEAFEEAVKNIFKHNTNSTADICNLRQCRTLQNSRLCD